MTQLSKSETIEMLTGLGDVKTGLVALASEVHLHGEILMRIVELLTPAEERSGMPLNELLAALIGRLDRQSVMLKEILEAQSNLRRNLPGEVAQAIDDTHEAGGSVANGMPGGKTNGASGQGTGHQP
jgi:hypothetical protein